MKAVCAGLAFLLAWGAVAPAHVHVRMKPAVSTHQGATR